MKEAKRTTKKSQIIKNGKEIIYHNLANMLTVSRMIMTFLFAYFVWNILQNEMNVRNVSSAAICLLSIWMSDLLDGPLARKLGIANQFGATLDVMADMLFVFLIHMQLAYQHLLSVWFIVLMIEKSVNYVMTSRLMNQKRGEAFVFIRDPIGKLVSASYFFTPVIVLMAYFSNGILQKGLYISIVLIALAGAISSIYRMQYTIRFMNESEKCVQRREENNDGHRKCRNYQMI